MILQARALRAACTLITALASAALVNAAIELSADAGALGGTATDMHQEGIFPAIAVAAVLLMVTCVIIALRARSSLLAAYRSSPAWERALFGAANIAFCLAAMVAIEAYETQFGGVQAFDAASVYVAHAPLVALACVLVAPVVGAVVLASLRAASSAGDAVVHILAWFCAIERALLLPAHRLARRFIQASHPRLSPALGAIALRAPPLRPMLAQLHAS